VTVPPADDVYKDAGTVQATISTPPVATSKIWYQAPRRPTSVTDTIDTTGVKLTATEPSAEGGTVTYTATVGAPVTGSPVA
jgi:surface adhesion protein